jgi:phospholipase C
MRGANRTPKLAFEEHFMIFPRVSGMEKIKHFVILMMENRSFDHYLGGLTLDTLYARAGAVDGIPSPVPSNNDEHGVPIAMWNMDRVPSPRYLGYPDLPHGPTFQESNNVDPVTGDKLAMFVKNYVEDITDSMTKANKTPAEIDAALVENRSIPMGYYTRDTLPIHYSLADNFAVCDAWYSSVLSSTWPNRKYLHCGKRDSDNDTQSVPKFPGFGGTPIWGVLEDQRDPDGNRITWKNYFTDIPFLLGWYKFAAFHAFGHFTSIDNFVRDCQADQLPTISILDPAFSLCDDHPTHDVRLGQKFIGLVVDALTNSESWDDTALIITYDENGGFFDHVSPPDPCDLAVAQDSPLGFRVPTIVLSPYTRPGVCSTVFDHTSILKSLMVWLQLDTDLFPNSEFGSRYACANDIWSSGCFDFTMAPRPAGTFTGGRPFPDLTWEHGINELVSSPIGDLEALLERMFLLPGLKLLDHRSQVFDHLNTMETNVVNLKRMT